MAPAWLAPVPTAGTLGNGVRVLVVTRTNLPMVVVHIATRGGADRQPIAGLGSFVGEMLEQGTSTRDAMHLSEAFAAIGAEHHAWVDWDSGNVWVKVLRDRLDDALALVAEMTTRPAFAEAEVERLRSQRFARLSQRVDAPDAILRDTVARVLYAGHVYGQPLIGNRESIARITPERCRSFYESIFVPERVHVAVVGDVDAGEVTRKLDALLGSWRPPKRALPVLAPAPVQRPGVFVVDRPGARQSHVAMCGIGPVRTGADLDAALVANAIFGGMGTSRLNGNLRETHAWTYGARSSFDLRLGSGPFTAGAAVETAHTVDAIGEMVRELEQLRRLGVTREELSRARVSLVQTLPGRFESNVATAASVAWLGVYGLPLDEYRSLPDRVEAVGQDEVRAAAARWLDSRKMRLVIVGDAEKFRDELAGLGLGPVRWMDADGRPVASR